MATVRRVGKFTILGAIAATIAVISIDTSYAFDNWVSLRDAGIVKQQRDFSCGAAALATLLTYFYRDPVSERELLVQLINGRNDHYNDHHNDQHNDHGSGHHSDHHSDNKQPAKRSLGLSFSDMKMLAHTRHYPAMGFAVTYEDLKNLRLPVIVALTVNGRGHFSVLRRVDEFGRAFLADPSWGNRQLGREEFLRSFLRSDDEASGRILIVGARGDRLGDDSFLHRPPRRVLISPTE
ncbi:cysteine peptidase family C39 domain-containing protein [Congregibacter brevis]|uniref:Cysteine peptidase family C39 domain-containing protein n=1 Tax=Congregibacter brevis TaxID=3081201 RepID=A0ABZ0I7K8_9GAMM|nr:cysteine peptidase family C39 domain-containing protein [Congregibacter sp. IMCC45268]